MLWPSQTSCCCCLKRGFSCKQLHAFLPSSLVSVHSCANFPKENCRYFSTLWSPLFFIIYLRQRQQKFGSWDFWSSTQKNFFFKAHSVPLLWIFNTICFDDNSKIFTGLANLIFLNFSLSMYVLQLLFNFLHNFQQDICSMQWRQM